MTFYSFNNTVQSHAYALSRLTGFATAMLMIVTCQRVNRWQVLSVGIILAAVLIMITDPTVVKEGHRVSQLAELIALGASIPGALMFSLNSKLRRAKISLTQLIMAQLAVIWLFSNYAAVYIGEA